jgi:hypothetical protein
VLRFFYLLKKDARVRDLSHLTGIWSVTVTGIQYEPMGVLGINIQHHLHELQAYTTKTDSSTTRGLEVNMDSCLFVPTS